MALKAGDKAPDFSLYDTDRNEVSLDDFRGKPVVLLFFPQAFSSTCTEELCAVQEDLPDYEKLGAQVLGISVDSVFTLAKYKEDRQLNFLLLSDFNKEVSRAYEALHESWMLNMKGVSKRSVFVIDKQGVIRYAEVLDNPGNLPNFEVVKLKLSDI